MGAGGDCGGVPVCVCACGCVLNYIRNGVFVRMRGYVRSDCSCLCVTERLCKEEE